MQQIADTRTDREAGREDAARQSRHRGRQRRQRLRRPEPQWRINADDHRARCRIARSPGQPGREHAQHGDHHPAATGKGHGMPLAPPRHDMPTARQPQHHARKQPAEGSPGDSRHRHYHQRGGDRHMGADRTEIDVVPLQALRDHAGDDDRRQHQQRHLLLIGGGKFLDREQHPGERRVECRRDTRRAAGDHHRALQRHPQQPVADAHHRRGDLHRRPFAPDTRAAQDRAHRQHDLADDGLDRDQPTGRRLRIGPRRHHLRNTGSACQRHELPCHPYQRHEAQRRGQQRQPVPMPRIGAEQQPHLVRSLGEQHRDDTDRNRPGDDRDPAPEPHAGRSARPQERAESMGRPGA